MPYAGKRPNARSPHSSPRRRDGQRSNRPRPDVQIPQGDKVFAKTAPRGTSQELTGSIWLIALLLQEDRRRTRSATVKSRLLTECQFEVDSPFGQHSFPHLYLQRQFSASGRQSSEFGVILPNRTRSARRRAVVRWHGLHGRAPSLRDGITSKPAFTHPAGAFASARSKWRCFSTLFSHIAPGARVITLHYPDKAPQSAAVQGRHAQFRVGEEISSARTTAPNVQQSKSAYSMRAETPPCVSTGIHREDLE